MTKLRVTVTEADGRVTTWPSVVRVEVQVDQFELIYAGGKGYLPIDQMISLVVEVDD